MTITDVLLAEHRIFVAVFDEIERVLPSLTTLAEARTFASVVEGLLRGHGAREANLAYLALDHVLADRGHLNRMHQDHEEIDARLRKVQEANTCSEARRLLKAALSSAREHFRMEEKNIFPQLDRLLQPATLTELARPWTDRGVDLAVSSSS